MAQWMSPSDDRARNVEEALQRWRRTRDAEQQQAALYRCADGASAGPGTEDAMRDAANRNYNRFLAQLDAAEAAAPERAHAAAFAQWRAAEEAAIRDAYLRGNDDDDGGQEERTTRRRVRANKEKEEDRAPRRATSANNDNAPLLALFSLRVLFERRAPLIRRTPRADDKKRKKAPPSSSPHARTLSRITIISRRIMRAPSFALIRGARGAARCARCSRRAPRGAPLAARRRGA
jgi:hypothetical protein